MAKVDPPPSPEEINKRRKEIKWILDPNDVPSKDRNRIMNWARTKMLKHEYLFKADMPDNYTIATGPIEPEELDVPAVYKFPNLNWRIFRDKQFFSIHLKSGMRILFKAQFGKI